MYLRKIPLWSSISINPSFKNTVDNKKFNVAKCQVKSMKKSNGNFLGNLIKVDDRTVTDERNIIATNKIVPIQKPDPARDDFLPKILSNSKHKKFLLWPNEYDVLD